MKIDRLIGIITLLLQHEKLTAPYLAEKFEVSRRTINRDIEDICKSGIPIVTFQGANGGIAIAEGYKIDRTLFTAEELRAISEGLIGLNSVSVDSSYLNIMDKFCSGKQKIYAPGHILIDLSSHYKQTLAPKISMIQEAIENTWEVGFHYYNALGERTLTLDPYLILFQWSSWYVFGYQHERKDFRMYKLNRLWHMNYTGRSFSKQALPKEKLDFGLYFKDEIHAVILFEKSIKYRLIEEYGPDCYVTCQDGRLRFESQFTNQDYLMEWVLSYGEKAELSEPQELRSELRQRLEKTLRNYCNDDI